MTADDLRARAAERRRVGWEIGDAMTPTEMENLARQLDVASRLVGDATADMGRAIADEREACAKIADEFCDKLDADTGSIVASDIADGIRARSTTA